MNPHSFRIGVDIHFPAMFGRTVGDMAPAGRVCNSESVPGVAETVVNTSRRPAFELHGRCGTKEVIAARLN
jgi:hypothetical protein